MPRHDTEGTSWLGTQIAAWPKDNADKEVSQLREQAQRWCKLLPKMARGYGLGKSNRVDLCRAREFSEQVSDFNPYRRVAFAPNLWAS